jgi:tetratricopeptide (TPR) repeat protein
LFQRASDSQENLELSVHDTVRALLEGCSLLLVGPGGVGKTHRLCLVRELLLGNEAYREATQPLRLATLYGREWVVASFFEFLLRVLGVLVARYPKEGFPEKVEGLYHHKDPVQALSAAKEALIALVGNATLLLLCDDLDELLGGLGDTGQRQWADLMNEHPGWVILGTASSVGLGALSCFFSIYQLALLDVEGAALFLRERAEREEQGGLVSFLDTPEGQASIAAAHHLLGGVPRAYVAFYEGLQRAGLRDLFAPFLVALRTFSLEYEARLWGLAPLQRKIVALLCEEVHPVTVKRVAERCLLSHQSAAKQLGELALLGLLQKTPVHREVYCELSLPSLRLYLDTKYQRAGALRGCLDFLQLWFLDSAKDTSKTPLQWASSKGPSQELEKNIQAAASQVDEQGAEGDFVALASAQWSAGRSKASLRTLLRGLIFHNSEVLFRLLGSSLFHPEAVLIEIDSMSEFAKRSSRLWELRGALLLQLRRFEEAIQNSEQLLATNPEYRALSWLQARALLGKGSQEGVLRLLSEILSTTTNHQQRQTVEHLGEMVLAESTCRGPMSAALFGESLRALLEAPHRGHLAGWLFTYLLKKLLRLGALSAEAWEPAITLWREAYAALDSCHIPLQMMQAAHRYMVSRDKVALFVLPLEQRALLLEVLIS